MPETTQAYLEAVREQIRWKRARPVLIQELERHLEDQREAFLREGKSPEEAERLAIQDMGDPVSVGTELDAVHRPRPQWRLLGLTIALAAVGAVLRVLFHDEPGDPAITLGKVLLSLFLGTGALLGAYFLDVSRLVRHARAVYIGALAAGALLLWFPHPARSASLSYAYYVILFYPIAYALWLYRFRGKGWRGFFLTILGGVPLAAVCCMVPSMVGLLTLLLAGLAVTLYAAGRDWFQVGRGKGICAVLAIPAVLLSGLISQGYCDSLALRINVALHPELDPRGKGFMGFMLQTVWKHVPPLRHGSGEASAAFKAGARVGWRAQPVDFSNDFLPASMAAQWGWIPLLVLLAALTVLLLWLLAKALRQSYLPGRMIVLAVVVILGLQTLFSAALNVGFVLFPASLPLVVGNLQTVMNMALIGLALSVFRGDSIAREETAASPWRRFRISIELI